MKEKATFLIKKFNRKPRLFPGQTLKGTLKNPKKTIPDMHTNSGEPFNENLFWGPE
jgi:hypothetical protein